jgi:hypothetical protein
VSLVVVLTRPSTTAGQAGEPRSLGLAMSNDGLEIAKHCAAIDQIGAAAEVEQDAINRDGGSVARPRTVMS